MDKQYLDPFPNAGEHKGCYPILLSRRWRSPFPPPGRVISQFASRWPNLKRLAIVDLPLWDGSGNGNLALADGDDLLHPASKLKGLCISGGSVTPTALTRILHTLRKTPLEVLCLTGTEKLGPSGLLEALRADGRGSKNLEIDLIDTRSFMEAGGLLFQLKEVVPNLEQLDLSANEAPQAMFKFLPKRLKRLSVKLGESTMKARDILKGRVHRWRVEGSQGDSMGIFSER
jgi:hypothetical protein